MKANAEIIEKLLNPGVIAVVRARSKEHALPLSRALLEGGLRAIEITLTTPDAIGAIRQVSAELGRDALIGVGSVLDEKIAIAAIGAGAQFVVSPIGRTKLVEVAHERGKAVMLGAATPTEAQAVHESGADFVKLFPAETLGPGYIKAIRAPLPHLRIVPTGGVDLGNIAKFFQAGCVAVGVGGSLLQEKILGAENWAELAKLAAQFVAEARKRSWWGTSSESPSSLK